MPFKYVFAAHRNWAVNLVNYRDHTNAISKAMHYGVAFSHIYAHGRVQLYNGGRVA